MKKGIVDKRIWIWIFSNYATLPIFGYYWGGVTLALIGLFGALLVDRYFPKWMYELSWPDIKTAIENQFFYGGNGCVLTFCIKKKEDIYL